MRFLTAALLPLVLLATACGSDEPRELAGIVRTPFPEVGELALPDVTNGGEPLRFVADPDDLLVVYFGYTSCPDVCPTTLADVRSALRSMSEGEAARIELAMATVDPERDVDEVITGYVQSFVPDAIGLRTTDDTQLQAAADGFGASYDVSTNDDGDVEVLHSAFLYVVDDEGLLRLTWPFGIAADEIAADLEQLLEET